MSNFPLNQNLTNKLNIPKSWTLLGSITPDTPNQIVLSDNVNNYDWIALLVHQGYASIDLIMPSYITKFNVTSRFSFNHGKPSGGWGMSGFVDIGETNFMLSEHGVEGWEFVALELYGIK